MSESGPGPFGIPLPFLRRLYHIPGKTLGGIEGFYSGLWELANKKGFGITDTSEALLWFGKDKKRSINRFKAYLAEAKDIPDKFGSAAKHWLVVV